MTRTCATCAHWDTVPDAERGLCRRFAPRPVVGQTGSIATDWPVTEDTDWCGEHTPTSTLTSEDT